MEEYHYKSDNFKDINKRNGVKKFMKISATNIKNRLKTHKLQETRPDWAERLFIKVYVTPNKMELGEISQAPKCVFPSVIIGQNPHNQ